MKIKIEDIVAQHINNAIGLGFKNGNEYIQYLKHKDKMEELYEESLNADWA